MTHRYLNEIWTFETIGQLINWKFHHLRILQIKAYFAVFKESFSYGFLKGNTTLADSVRQWVWRSLTQYEWFQGLGKNNKVLHIEINTLYFQKGTCAPNIPLQSNHCKILAKRLLKISRILSSITWNF